MMAEHEVPPGTAEASAEDMRQDLPAGMAVLVSVPFEIAKRLESFLQAHGIACEVRKPGPEPEGPSPKGSKKPEPGAEPYDTGMRHAARNLLKVKSTPPPLPDLTLERDPRPVYDVLVREEDLARSAVAGEAVEGTTEMLEMIEGVAGELVVVAHLPWQDAWALAGRLTEGGIPAVAVPEAGEDRETTLERRIIPVAVRPEDLEAARVALSA
jgi:hypothetical protein